MSQIAETTRKRTVHSPLNSPGVTDTVHDVKISSKSKSREGFSSCMILSIVGGISIIVVLTLSLYWGKLAGRNSHMFINNKIQLPPEFDQGHVSSDKRHIHDVLDDINIPADRTKRKQTSGDSSMKATEEKTPSPSNAKNGKEGPSSKDKNVPSGNNKNAADKKTPPPSNAKNGKQGPSSKDINVPSRNNKNGNAKVDKSPPAKETHSDTSKKAGKMEKTPPPKIQPPAASGKDEPAKKSQPSKPVSSNNANGGKKETVPPVAKESPGKGKNEQGSRVPTPKIVTNDAGKARDKQDKKPSEEENGGEKETSSTVAEEPPAKEKKKQVLHGPNPKTVSKDTVKTRGTTDQKLSENNDKEKSKESVAKDTNEGSKAENGKKADKNIQDESQEEKNSPNVKPLKAANKSGAKVDPK